MPILDSFRRHLRGTNRGRAVHKDRGRENSLRNPRPKSCPRRGPQPLQAIALYKRRCSTKSCHLQSNQTHTFLKLDFQLELLSQKPIHTYCHSGYRDTHDISQLRFIYSNIYTRGRRSTCLTNTPIAGPLNHGSSS